MAKEAAHCGRSNDIMKENNKRKILLRRGYFFIIQKFASGDDDVASVTSKKSWSIRLVRSVMDDGGRILFSYGGYLLSATYG